MTQKLSKGAERAITGANAQTGRLPQGTPVSVVRELRDAGLVARVGLTSRGKRLRDERVAASLDDAFGEL